MGNEFMRRAKDKGFDKFTEIGQAYWELINSIRRLKSDLIVYILSHTDTDANGKEKCKTIGKMLDEKITVEGMFTIVLGTKVKADRSGNKYYFITQNNGSNTLKSPMGMFDLEIDNDLAVVDRAIREYYELDEVVGNTDAVTEAPKEEVKNLAEEVAEEVKAPEPSRRRNKTPEVTEVKSEPTTEPTPTPTTEPTPTESVPSAKRSGRRNRENRD